MSATENKSRFKKGQCVMAYVMFGLAPLSAKVTEVLSDGGFRVEITDEADHASHIKGETLAVSERQLVSIGGEVNSNG